MGGKLEKALSCSCKDGARRSNDEGSGDSRAQNYCSKAKSLSQGSVEAARGCHRSARHRHFREIRKIARVRIRGAKLMVALGSQISMESHVRPWGADHGTHSSGHLNSNVRNSAGSAELVFMRIA